MKFIAIDFETANPTLASICQIGIATFDNGINTETWQTLVDPEDYFYPQNVAVHGIEAAHVINAPKFPEVYDYLRDVLKDQIVAHHGSFDRIAFQRVSEKYNLPPLECCWLDTVKVARRTWAECSSSGYGLRALAARFGIDFDHHKAHEDARVAGIILTLAMRENGTLIEEWTEQLNESISSGDRTGRWFPKINVSRDGNPDGPLKGETIVFTGALTISRQDAANLAAEAGCDVGNGVTKATTILIVGNQDLRLLGGHEKSSKHRKAETLMANGQSIRILEESDFLRLIECEKTVIEKL